MQSAVEAARRHPAVSALPSEVRSQLGARVTLELEVAGAPEPLVGRTFEEIAKAVEPGECGLALRHADRWSYQPASQLMAKRMTAPLSRALLAMVSDLQLPPRDLPDLQEAGSTAVYAVRGVRLAQVAPDAAPITLARLLPSRAEIEVPRAEHATLAAAIAARLDAQLAPRAIDAAAGASQAASQALARGGLSGDYIIAADDDEPLIGAPADQALAAWALARAGATQSWPQDLRKSTQKTAIGVLRALAAVDAAEQDPATDPAAVAFVLLAQRELEEAHAWDASDVAASAFIASMQSAARTSL